MNTNTKYFGDVTYEEKDLLCFSDGLYGFETFHNYLLIHFNPDNHNLLCLQSLEDQELAFILINPFSVSSDYKPEPSKEDMNSLSLTDDSEVSVYALCVVREPLETSTINLKCPIIINPLTRHAKQIILEDSSYGLKHPLGNQALV